MEIIKVLQCLPAISSGGAEKQLRNLIINNPYSHIHNSVLAWKSGEYYEEYRRNGIDVFLVNELRKYPILCLWQIIRIINKTKPDIIHSWSPQTDIILGLLGKIFGVIVICSERSSSFLYEDNTAYKGKWFTILRPWILTNCASALVTNSIEGKKYLIKILKKEIPIFVIKNGIVLHQFDIERAYTKEDLKLQNFPTIITVSRLEIYKRINLIIEAIAYLGKSGRYLNLIVCGDGPEKKNLEHLARELKVEERIYFLGFRSDVISILKSADFFCSASIVEGSPNAMLEAMACKLPIIASDIDAHKDLFSNHEIGFVFKTDSFESLVEKITLLLDNPKVLQMKMNSYNLASSFSVVNMCVSYKELYESFSKNQK
mgnify:CR=1 FL=1